MTDYKELIESLREEAEAVQAIEWEIPICTSNHILDAADAIERLVKERDAAVADLKCSRVCFTCKHISDPDCNGCHANMDRWEWRGIKEESNET